MGTTLSVTFPLGRYHATRWDGGANTSDVEWPPSPWRILRGLIATWYTRWPDLPAEDIDRVLGALGTPDAYMTPPALPGSTRHYMPDARHSKSETGNTDQVIDSFLAVPPDSPLLIHWASDLPPDDRATLGKLVELMPYLGRSESVCVAALSDGEPVPDANWWRLGETGPGSRQAELLTPDGVTQRALLEATTTATRKARRILPVGARRVSYGTHASPYPIKTHRPARQSEPVHCLRFDLSSQVPVRAGNGVLVTDALHAAISKTLIGTAPGAATAALLGLDDDGKPRRELHDHLHVLALPIGSEVGPLLRASTPLASVFVWAPAGIAGDAVGTLQRRIRKIWTRHHLEGEMATQYLLTAGSGPVERLLPELARTATEWLSAMPYLPVRHQKKRQPDDEFLDTDIRFERGYRHIPVPSSVELVDGPEHRREITQFRRRRTGDNMNKQRRGAYLRLRFDEPVTGPLLLGQLSHFGFGLFAAL